MDATLGKALEWAGRRWSKGRSESERLRAVYRDLAAAMTEAIAAAAKLGRGYTTEAKYVEAGAGAELRVGAVSAEITDEELVAAIRGFRSAAAVVFGRGTRDQAWVDQRNVLRMEFDRATDRIRVLQREL